MKKKTPANLRKVEKKIKKLVAEGRYVIKDIPVNPVPIEVDGYTFIGVTIDGAWEREDSVGFVIRWACKGVGFGELTFYRRPKEGPQLHCQNECMGPKFCTAVLKAFLASCKLADQMVM
jgi:hypothetical protein